MSILHRDTTLTKIFVGGLPYHTTDESLQKFFDQFGQIEEAVVITDRQTGKSKGYGFVTMTDRVGAERACKDPNPIIDGRKANVNLAYLGAKPRVQAGELLAFPINIKSGLANAYPGQLSRLTPFIHPSQAYITATGAPTLALPQLPPTPTAAAAGSTTLYPVSPATPTGTGNSLVNYPTFAYPQIIQGYDTSAYPYSALIGYITPSHAAAAAAAGYNPFAASAISPSAASGSASFGQLIPTMHCFQPQQILQERLQ